MNSFRRFAVICAALLLLSVAASAQTTSNLTGKVILDGNGLPGVTVTISSPALLGTRTTVTDVNGNYNFAGLPPGAYTVRFEMESMQTQTRNVQVTLSGTARADAEMRLTAVAEAITVTAAAPAVLETTEVQTNLQAELVNNLPTQRTLQATTALAPGVTTTSGTGGAAAGSIAISGAPAYDSVFMINGATVNENLRGQAHNLFIEDAIQETTVLTAGVSAEFGRFTGGVVNAITKSGGNEFSGSLRDTVTNDTWTAEGELRTTDPIDTTNHVYEGTLGGRIIRDRLWFFAAGRYAERSQNNTLANELATGYVSGTTDTRYEGKLTGQLTSKHSLVASYLDATTEQTNNCPFGGCLEFVNLDVARELPNTFLTLHYNGIITNSLLIEGTYANKDFSFVGSGGDFTDRIRGTALGAYGTGEGYLGAPFFCGVCDDEERNNDLWGAKATYYLASKSFGTHSIVTGYENWTETRLSNNYQTASNYIVYLYDDANLIAPTCTGASAADITCRPQITTGDELKWNPIFELSQGSDFQTQSLFVNDKWDLNDHWNFNLGVRYDKNNGKDSSGITVADDASFSPRLGLAYDVLGDGRFRFNGSYSKYVSRIAESIGSIGAGGGNPSYLYYEYTGPTINPNHTLTTQEALAQLFAWFDANGGNNMAPTRGTLSGVNQKIVGSLKSPSVDEWSVGFGSQITSNAFIRVDYAYKDWNDFYARYTNRQTGTVPAVVRDANGNVIVDLGTNLDFTEVTNSDDYDRKYNAATVQAAWRPFQRINVGANYTWSTLKGNVTSENTGSGPVPESAFQYPEYKAFAQNNPSGYLPGDQRHKLRAWVSYDQPTPFGTFNFSLLQRFDSGTPYSATTALAPSFFTTTRAGYTAPFLDPASLSYAGNPGNVTYYLSDRGQFRWDDISSTDLAINYELPIRRVSLFAQAKMINSLNNQGLINGNTAVVVDRAWNPFTETPVEGVHWHKGPNFGKGTQPTTSAGGNLLAPNGHYQLPRTYLFSAGLRF
ncbi:MAG TPA: TonB-dependent receptor [Thermoanaerobaculia bacterium]|jgi:hypothetical protein